MEDNILENNTYRKKQVKETKYNELMKRLWKDQKHLLAGNRKIKLETFRLWCTRMT